MKTWVDIDASELPRLAPRTHPLWWGVACAVAIEAAVVANLLASYFYLMAQSETPWPPAGVASPPLFWPTVFLVLLPLSSVTMWWAGRGSDRGDKRQLAIGVTASVVLACIALVARSFQIAAFEVKWSDSAYGSILWTITGFHFTHVVSAILGTAVVALYAWRGYFTPSRQLGVVVDTLYWYFVAAIFVPIYLVLIWAPRIL